MRSLSLLLVISALIATIPILTAPTLAQGTQQNAYGGQRQGPSPQGSFRAPGAPVATRPSDNPFQNPIGQGVPPAVSANPARNSNLTSAPR